jgi:hypothetical protein
MNTKKGRGKRGRCIALPNRGMGLAMRATISISSVLMLCCAPVPASAARNSLGTFEDWGAFRDDAPARCFAIAEPTRRGGGKWRSFASVATWPGQNVRGQVHIRLAREKLAGAPVTLAVGGKRFAMVAGGADVWAPDPRADAAIVAAMRSAPSMTIATRAATGGAFSETYALKGAATAMDAAALGCARG